MVVMVVADGWSDECAVSEGLPFAVGIEIDTELVNEELVTSVMDD